MRVTQDVVEEILERLPVKSLLRFKLVSTTWKSTIESQRFKERHMNRRQLQEPAYLLIDPQEDDDQVFAEEYSVRILALGPPDLIDDQDHDHADPEFGLRLSFDDVSRSCDGLVCIYKFRRSIFVANPSTKWIREVPMANVQNILSKRYYECEPYLIGIGKDICTKTYKLVWLYNSSLADLERDKSICEVFDFNINTWRYVESSSPYLILCNRAPIYVDGSLHWFILKSDTEIKVISFDCHTEIFQEISESPITQEDERQIVMCNLNNRLCVSEKNWPVQDIWTLNSSDMTWEKMYSLDLSSCPAGLLGNGMEPVSSPLAVLNKRKLLLYDRNGVSPNFVIYDLETRAYSLRFDASFTISATPFFQSLISII